MQRTTRARRGLTFTTSIALAVSMGFAGATQAQAAEMTRTGGSDRIATGLQVYLKHRDVFTSDTVVLAGTGGFADALTAAPLAAAYRAPVLTTSGKTLDARVLDAIKSQAVKRVVVVGGKGAVSDSVLRQIAAAGVKTERIGGGDRFETSRLVAERVMAVRGATSLPVFVAEGMGFADALATGSAAAQQRGVILLARDGRLGSAETAFIKKNASSLTAVGGGAVTATKAAGLKARTLSGSDRYATAALVAETFFTSPVKAVMASGEDYGDAVSGSALAALSSSPLLLTRPTALPAQTAAYLAKKQPNIEILGGIGAIPASVAGRAEEVADSGSVTPPTNPTPAPSPTPTPSPTSPTPTPPGTGTTAPPPTSSGSMVVRPTVTSGSVTYGQTLSVNGNPTVTGNDGGVSYSLASDGGLKGVQVNSGTGALSGTISVRPGTYHVVVKATDSKVGTPQTATYPVAVTVLPTDDLALVPTVTASVPTGQALTVAAPTNITGKSGTLTYTLKSNDGLTGVSVNSATGALAGNITAPARQTPYTVTVVATDSADGDTTEWSTDITVTAGTGWTVSPSVTSATVTYRDALAVAAAPRVSGNTGAVTYAIADNGGLTGVELANAGTGALAGTITAKPGTYGVTIEATDSATPTAKKFRYTVTVVVKPTDDLAVTATSPGAVTTGQTLSVAGPATVTGKTGTVTYALQNNGGLTGVDINASNGALSGTITAPGSATPYTVTIRATDDADGDYADYTVKVYVTAPFSVTPSTTNGTVVYGKALSVPASNTVTGSVGDVVYTVDSDGGLTGLQIDRRTGALSGSVTGTVGRHEVVVKATDSRQGSPQTTTYKVVVTVQQSDDLRFSAVPTVTVAAGSAGTSDAPAVSAGKSGTLSFELLSSYGLESASVDSNTGRVTATVPGGTATGKTFTAVVKATDSADGDTELIDVVFKA